ncbi:MAG: response regulator, partial [Syntrophomonadaceae bacterium]|nr:response regulator [Syntrophomonadaceae bacterium]
MEPRILIIDDEEDFLDSVKRGLQTAGYRDLTTLSNPVQTWETVCNNLFDLALIDLTMPEINGLELLEHIKLVSPETECIMITAVEEVEMAVKAMRLGAYDYLTKPLSRDKLLIAIDRALERKRLLNLL